MVIPSGTTAEMFVNEVNLKEELILPNRTAEILVKLFPVNVIVLFFGALVGVNALRVNLNSTIG